MERCRIRFDPVGGDLHAVIGELADVAVADGLLSPDRRDEAVQAVTRRELSGSTVMPGGIAFPHGRTGAVTELTAVLGVFRGDRGLPAADGGEPTWLVVLMFVPLDAGGTEHIHFLARISRRLMKADVVARLRAADREDEARDALGV